MEVRALGDLSGAVGDRAKGEEFVVTAEVGSQLLGRKLVEKVEETSAAPVKTDKADKADKVKE